MTNLTEQWKKGELPEGWYYVKDENGVIYAAENCLNYDSLSDKGYTAFYYAETEISEILSPVPTYHEYLALQSDSLAKNEGAEIVAELEEDNKKLKELLKECKHIMSIEKDFASCHFEKDKLCKLLTQINQALGEDK